MIDFKTPGVYIREVEVTPPARLRFDVTGLVGQAERGPLNRPQLLTSWGQYREIFGDFVGFSFLPYAVYGFFSNGGQRCYVVRVAHEGATKATADDFEDQAGAPAIRVEALNAGKWANAVEVSIIAESRGGLILTQLAEGIAADQRAARVQSVAGLKPGDAVTLVHRSQPKKLTIERVASETKLVTFAESAGREFPAGSSLLGRGFTLSVRYWPGGRLALEEVFENLSLDEANPRYFVRVINGEPEEPDYVKRVRNGNSILVRVQDLGRESRRVSSRPQAGTQFLKGGADGSRDLGMPGDHRYYTGYDDEAYFRPIPPDADESTRQALEDTLFGMAGFEAVEEIALVAIPDLIVPDLYAATSQVERPKAGIVFARVDWSEINHEPDNLKAGQHAMVWHCEKTGDRFAILDSPPGFGPDRVEEWPSNFRVLPGAKYGALYYPWIKQRALDFDGRELFIPPSGHLAGIYARSENERGLGKAPANEILRGVVELEYALGDAEQSRLNPAGVNCLRCFPGRGLRVWGARTLCPDPLWRYVNVRRVSLAIVKTILVRLRSTVFEPNNPQLYARIVATLTLLLNDLFASGALAGSSPAEAFFVKCDAELNPREVVDRGEVITRIGFAPARPAEFVLVTIKRTAESLTVSEQTI
jgi:phage tail sheath protein FI